MRAAAIKGPCFPHSKSSCSSRTSPSSPSARCNIPRQHITRTVKARNPLGRPRCGSGTGGLAADCWLLVPLVAFVISRYVFQTLVTKGYYPARNMNEVARLIDRTLTRRGRPPGVKVSWCGEYVRQCRHRIARWMRQWQRGASRPCPDALQMIGWLG